MAQLAIDLGTSHTVAVVRRDDREPRALLLDGLPLTPSGVFAGPDGVLHTGRDAERLAQVQPERYEPHPKRRVDEGSVLLGDREVPVPALLAAVLGRVAREAADAGVRAHGGTVLTCPADWGRRRRGVLGEAARLAGLGEVTLVDEPVAAATYCLDVLGHAVSPGQTLVVFDFGAGTLDLTLVRREPAGLRVLATGGLDDLGGLDVDAALVGHLGHVIALRDEPTWRRLSAPRGPADLRDRRALWQEVKAAKEMLSRTTSAPVQVPGWTGPAHLTRDELERVAGPLVARAVDETRRLLERAGPDRIDLAGLFLVGGSSRVPLVSSRLHARFGLAPTVPEQPELPVAHGALLAVSTPAQAPRPTTQAPPPVQPYIPMPASGAPSGPPLGTPAGPAAAPARRPRRALVAVLAVVAALALITGGTYGVYLLTDRNEEAANARPNSARPAQQSSGGGSGDTPADLVRCDEAQLCPAEPICWAGLVSISGAPSSARKVDCEQPHYWETYAAGRLPDEATSLNAEELAQHPDVIESCNDAAMGGRAKEGGGSVDGWKRDIIAQDSGQVFHCVAGPPEGGERTGSVFRAG